MTHSFRYFACPTLTVLAVVTGALGQQAADPYKEALHYKFDQPRTAVMAIEAEIRAAKPEQLRTIEGKLPQILQSPEATTDAKAWVCRQLRQAGSERSVDALAPLLADKELATVARLALQSIPGQKVDDALRGAVGRLHGDLLAGVLQTIGVRGDRQALSLLAPLASDKDPVVAEAALFALGHIGGAEAFVALQDAKVPDSLKRYRYHAMLLCAERMAAPMAYRAVFGQSKDPVIQAGALRGIVLHDKTNAASGLISALKSDQRKLRAAAAKFLCELGNQDMLAPVLAGLSSLPSDAQVMILTMVNDKSALPAALKAAESPNNAVCDAAYGALGRLGDASTVPFLLREPVAAREFKGTVVGPHLLAAQSLQELRGEGVLEALMAAARDGKPPERNTAIAALHLRRERSSVPLLLKIVQEPDSDQHRTAQRLAALNALLALKELADPRALPVLVELLVKPGDILPQRDVQEAIIETCRHMENRDAATAPVLAALPGAPARARCALLGVLASVPSAKSLEALRAALSDGDAEVNDTAVYGLAVWPDPAAAVDLLAIARNDKNPKHKILALRGVIRLAGPASKLPATQAVTLLTEAMSLAGRPKEKKLALAALGEVKHPAAIDLAAKCLSDQALEVEAATAVVKIAKGLRATNPDAAAAAIRKVLDVCKSPAARQLAESAMIVLGGMVNIASQGTATSPDGLDKDGTAGDDQAGIDGDAATYWDEKDGQKLYRFVVAFRQPERIAAISIMGYEHHRFAPKDFEVLCDGKAVKKVENAQYDGNFLLLRLDEVACTSVELKITGCYGQSPAVRELGIYRAKVKK